MTYELSGGAGWWMEWCRIAPPSYGKRNELAEEEGSRPLRISAPGLQAVEEKTMAVGETVWRPRLAELVVGSEKRHITWSRPVCHWEDTRQGQKEWLARQLAKAREESDVVVRRNQ